jgi:hypothetical protein
MARVRIYRELEEKTEREGGEPGFTAKCPEQKIALGAGTIKPEAVMIEGIRQVSPESIPEELRDVSQWVAWRAERRGNGKINKIPVNVKTGGNASTSDPTTWSTYEEVFSYYQNADGNGIAGIGFVFTRHDPYCGIDLDDCRDPGTNQLSEQATAILDELDTYCEISPSDRGVKAFARGNLPNGAVTGEGIEIYHRGRFFCVTGGRVDTYSGRVEERQDKVMELCTRLSRESRCTTAGPQPAWQDGAIRGVGAGSRHRTALQLAGRWARKRISDAEIAHFIVAWNRNNTPPKPELSDTNSTELTDIIRYARGEGPCEAPDLLSFPNVIAGAAGEFADLFEEYLEVPRAFLLIAYLTCLGSVLAERVTTASELETQPRLFAVLIGQSADERKSTALLKTTALFKSAVEDFATSWGTSSGEGLQKTLEHNYALLLCLDEFKSFVSKCKIQSSVLLPCVNTLFESNRYESRTKKTAIVLEDAYLSILAASTIQSYESIWDARFIDIGFVNRLFIVPGTAERRHSFPARIPEEQKEHLKQRIRAILSHVGGHMELDITQEARETYHSWYMACERSVHAKRLDTYAMRFMILLSVNERKTEIDLEIVQKVIALMDWQLIVRKVFDPIDADSAVAKMEEKIRRVLISGPKTDRELKQRTNANRAGLWIYNVATKNLKESDEIMRNKDTKKWEGIE